MNQEKIGKFIIECRKSKGLTQSELGSKLGVSDKTVSKWERGINIPDVSLLNSLSKELGVSIDEILNGGKIKTENIISTQICLKHLFNKLVHKKSLCISMILIILILIFSLIFTINSYDKIKVYSISSDDDNVIISGYVVFTPEIEILTITELNYITTNTGTSLEDKVSYLQVVLMSKDTTIFTTDNMCNTNDDYIPLAQVLGTFSINIFAENDRNYASITVEDLADAVIYIYYIDSDKNQKVITINVDFKKEYSNNRLFPNL